MVHREIRTEIKKDAYYAMVILSASVVISGALLLFSDNKLLFALGVGKVSIAFAILAYTVRFKIGQKKETYEVECDNNDPYSPINLKKIDWSYSKYSQPGFKEYKKTYK